MHIISEVLVDRQKSRVLKTIKDLGTVYFPWLHRFPTKKTRDGNTRRQILEKFAEYSPRIFSRIPAFGIMQITAPTNVEQQLNEEQKALFTANFVKGHFQQQANWEEGVPGFTAEVDPRLAEALKHKKQQDKQLEKALDETAYELQKSPTARKRHITNFDNYIARNWETIAELGSNIKKARQKAETPKKRLEDKIKELGIDAQVEINPKNKCLDIITKDKELIKAAQCITGEQVQNSKICIFDIEKPLFNTKDEELSWLASILADKGKILKKTIRTLRDTGTNRIGSWDIKHYNSEKDLVEAVTKEITMPDSESRTVSVLRAYNHPYDIENTREAGEFLAGERHSEPKVQIAMDFFRKNIIRGKLIDDPLRAARTRYKHAPNKKLELILAMSLGIKSAKILNYEELALLEKASKTGDMTFLTPRLRKMIKEQTEPKYTPEQRCAQLIAFYSGADVDYLYTLSSSQWYTDFLTDISWISTTYGIEMSRLLHLPGTINDIQEKAYWQNVGVPRDVIYPRVKKLMQLRQKGKDYTWQIINRTLCSQSKRGIHRNLAKAYVPLGLWLSDLIGKEERFTDVKKLVEYAQKFKQDKLRYFTLLQYLEALANLITVDFGLHEKQRTAYESELSASALTRQEFREHLAKVQQGKILSKKLDELEISSFEFENAYNTFRANIEEKSESGWGVKNLDKGRLRPETIKKYATARVREICKKHGLDYTALAELFMLRAPRRRGTGQKSIDDFCKKHRISTQKWKELRGLEEKTSAQARRIFGQYTVSAFQTRKTLEDRLKQAKKFCNKNGIRIIHAQKSFVYLWGNTDALRHPDAPLILVDEIPAAYIALNFTEDQKKEFRQDLQHKIYYAKHRYFEGIKVTDRPSHHYTMFEMQAYAPIIEHLANGNIEDALRHANNCLEKLRKGQVPNKDLVWHTKKTGHYKMLSEGKKIIFVQNTDGIKDEQILEDKDRTRYFEIPRKQRSKNKVPEPLKVHITSIDKLQPDTDAYLQFFSERIRKLVEPVIEKSTEFVSEFQTDVSRFVQTSPFG